MAVNPLSIEELRKMMKKSLRNKYLLDTDQDDEIDDPFIEKKTDIVNIMKVGAEINPYHCLVCNCWMNSPQVVKAHIKGGRHIQRKRNRTLGGKIPPNLLQAACVATELIKRQAGDDPVVGLDFIVEYHPELDGEIIFDCELCGVKTSIGSFVTHLLGSRHRLAYLRLMEEDKYFELTETYERKSELNVHLTEKIRQMAKIFGPGEVTISKMEVLKQATATSIQEAKVTDATSSNAEQNAGSKTNDKEPFFNQPELSFQGVVELVSEMRIENQRDALTAVNVGNYIMEAILQYQLKRLPSNIYKVIKEAFNDGDTKEIQELIRYGSRSPPSAPLSDVPESIQAEACTPFSDYFPHSISSHR